MKNICKELFRSPQCSNGFIIALLGFALELDGYLLRRSDIDRWYNTDLLIDSLASVLESTDIFEPTQLRISKCILFLLLICNELFSEIIY